MRGSAWIRLAWVLAAAGLITLATMPAMGSEPHAFGERLVAQHRLPPDTIARYAALAAGTALDVVAREDSRFADRLPWVGPAQRAGVGHNPYTLVLTVRGVAKSAGEVYAQWQAGWEVRESPLASRELLLAVPLIARAGLAAGQALTLTASSGRVSFRGERHVAPMLGLVQMRNLEIQDIQVQVWSGEAPHAWSARPWSRAALLAAGLACLLIGLGYKYWQRGGRVSAAAPQRSIELPNSRPASDASPADGQAAAAEAARESPAPTVAPAPVPATQSNEARVLATLQHVVMFGLNVPTVLDASRKRKRRPPP